MPALDWQPDTAIDRYFKATSLVYRGVMALATAIGSVRWQVQVKSGNAWQPDESHPLQALLDQPHPFFNRQALTELMVLYLGIVGESFFQKTLASGKLLPGALKPRVLEIGPLVPVGMTVVPGDANWIDRYEYTGQPRRTWTPDEMLHVMLPDPGNLYRGLSPLLPSRKVIAMDVAAVDWNLSSMANRAIADGVFTTKQPLTTPQYEELKDQIWEQHQGTENAHEPWVIGAGEWQEMSRTPVEMDFNETRMRTREDVLSAVGVPPVLAGYFENATLANAEMSRRMFWEDDAIPTYAERIVGAFNGRLVPHFGQPGKLRVTYDISGIPALREDLLKKLTAFQLAINSGVPYNEALAELELGFQPIPDLGDVPYGTEALKPGPATPLGDPALTDGAPADVPVGTSQDVQVSQAAVLNGAQITAATAIVTAVAAGDIPRDAGMGQLIVLFNLTPDQAEQIMGAAGTEEPTTPNPKPITAATDDVANTPPPPQPPQLAGRRPGQRKTLAITAGGGGATGVADQEASAIRRAFLSVMSKLRDGASLEELVAAVRAGDAGAALSRLGAHRLDDLLREQLGKAIERTAARGADLAAEELARQVGADLSLSGSRLNSWLVPYLKERITQLVGTTEEATRGLFFDLASGRLGDDMEAVAKLASGTWGLHKQQAAGVRNLYDALLKQGKEPDRALAAALKLADVRLRERANTIATHESLTAANQGESMAWHQALADGQIVEAFAMWGAEPDAEEECASLDGQEIRIGSGERFHGMSGATYEQPPEPHPGCRCLVVRSAVT